MREIWRSRRPLLIVAVLLAGMLLFVAVLGYRAASRWHDSAAQAAERRADEVFTIFNTVVARDMKGVQQDVLLRVEPEELAPERQPDLVAAVADAFARFPYPEVFFTWDSQIPLESEDVSRTVLFSRADRTPEYWTRERDSDPFPVRITPRSWVANYLATAAVEASSPTHHFAVVETTVGETSYQVVARFFFDRNSSAIAAIGFGVNLEWVRDHYFADLVRHIARIGDIGSGASALSVKDDSGAVVGANIAESPGGPVRETRFPLAFFDSTAVPVGELAAVPIRQYTARVSTAGDPLFTAADSYARLTRYLIVLAAAISIASIALAAYSLRTRLQLEAMKADFVAQVSHELKTPLASIRLIAETLGRRRYGSEQTVSEYGSVLTREAMRLDHLVQQLLTFSRITNPRDTYNFARVDVAEALEEALDRLHSQLQGNRFSVEYVAPESDCGIWGDFEAVVQVFQNVIDNAIKYSPDTKRIRVHVESEEREITVVIEDSGQGIDAGDVPRVFDRFFRSDPSGPPGTGLGLAIARRITGDHGGHITLESDRRSGTRVTITFPREIDR